MARPRKQGTPKVGGSQQFKEELKRKGVSVEHLADLERYDRTEVYGKDPDKVYRWCREKDIGLRNRQGFEKSDGKGMKVAAPGGDTYWAPEGRDAKQQKAGLILMEMPKTLHDARQEFKQRRRDEETRQMDESLRSDMQSRVDPQMARVLGEDDPFIKELKGAGR